MLQVSCTCQTYTTRALSQLSSSGWLYILQINFSANLNMFRYESHPYHELQGQDSNIMPSKLTYFHGEQYRTRHHIQWSHGIIIILCWSDPLGKWQTSRKLYEHNVIYFGFGDVPDLNHRFMHAISLKCGTSTPAQQCRFTLVVEHLTVCSYLKHPDTMMVLLSSAKSPKCVTHYFLAFRVRLLGLDHRRPNTKYAQAYLRWTFDVTCQDIWNDRFVSTSDISINSCRNFLGRSITRSASYVITNRTEVLRSYLVVTSSFICLLTT